MIPKMPKYTACPPTAEESGRKLKATSDEVSRLMKAPRLIAFALTFEGNISAHRSHVTGPTPIEKKAMKEHTEITASKLISKLVEADNANKQIAVAAVLIKSRGRRPSVSNTEEETRNKKTKEFSAFFTKWSIPFSQSKL